MKTIAEQWLEFSAMVLPDNVSDVQRTEMRRAFYAGFKACLSTWRDLDEHYPVEADALKRMNEYVAESREFYERVKAGRA